MYFTEGQLCKYERMMQEKPRFDREPINKAVNRDCKHCLYFDDHLQKCNKEKCVVFVD